jgi:hypothetical protein
MTDVEAKALGLISNNTTVDAYVGFADTNHFTFDYNRSAGITAGHYDFFGTAIHEITEVMGRELGVGQQLINNTNTYYPLDLFHYVHVPLPVAYAGTAGVTSGTIAGPQVAQEAATAAGSFLQPWQLPIDGIVNEWHVRDFSRGGYFSFDGGVTELADFNSLSSGDAGDWAPSAGNDSFLNSSYPGHINNVSAADLSLMDVLGYDRAPFNTIDEIVGAVQSDYFAITRTTLPVDQATTEANSISSGAHTESQYISDLLAQVADTTIPAVAVEASMYGAVGSSAEVTSLVTQFLPAQVANAIQNGLNPQVYACEALGLVFAFGDENGGTAFATNFGPSNAPATAAGDAAFAAAAASAIFGSAATANTPGAILGFLSNWEAFYTSHGIPGVANATADQIVLAARGSAWGDAVGVALANNLGSLHGQAVNFLEDAAQGTANYSASLATQLTAVPFQGATTASVAATAEHVQLLGVAATSDHAIVWHGDV